MRTTLELWRDLEQWASGHAPNMIEDLNDGATDDQILALEQALGMGLPRALKESLKIHNGESDGWPCKVFADRGAYLSCERILQEWENRRAISADIAGDWDDLPDPDSITVDGPVRPKLFIDRWIPFLECNGDVFWALDYSPADGGAMGQVIEVDWEGCSWLVLASSFLDFFETYVSELENGAYFVIDGRPTKHGPDSEEKPSHPTLKIIEQQPTLKDLRLMVDGAEIELVVSGFESETTGGMAFKVDGGFVSLTGSLATGMSGSTTPSGFFYRVIGTIRLEAGETTVSVRSYEILEGFEEVFSD